MERWQVCRDVLKSDVCTCVINGLNNTTCTNFHHSTSICQNVLQRHVAIVRIEELLRNVGSDLTIANRANIEQC